mgnify:CR=1 FL=1
MFGEFLNIIFKSIKLDKSLYTDGKNFGEASVYFYCLIMILYWIAVAVAANTEPDGFKLVPIAVGIDDVGKSCELWMVKVVGQIEFPVRL